MKHVMLNQIKIAVVLLLLALVGCTEKETQVEVSSVSLNTATIEMVEGETFSLVATVLPKDAEYDGVIWASSNASVASVSSGTVTAVKEGTATITASAGGKSSTCTVKVSAKVVPVTSITLDKTSLSMKVGETETITATVNPANATDKTVTWSSSDVSVATVADGRVTAKKSGTAIITAKSGSCIAECTVTISVDVESVTLDKTNLSLAVGETSTLTATVKPDDATDKNVAWTSSDESVAKVDNGKVSALKSGKATITAKCGGKTVECAVTVTVPTGSVTLDKTSLSLAVGETAQLTAMVMPEDATDKNVNWTSSDESIAKVDNGKVTAVKSGNATITAKCGGKTAECAVTVTVPTDSVTLDKTSISLAVGETAQLAATVKPDDATDKNVVWTSSDESVSKVDNGKVTAIKAGKATITVKCSGKTAECIVTVTVPTYSVTLDKTSLTLSVGETAQLAATVKPDDATDKNVTWTSSNESVAKVDNGKVTAVKSGNAIITAKCGGKTAECAVTVTVPTGSVTLDKATLSLAVGETSTLTATVKPDDATDKTVIWASSDESVATVANGKVTAVKAGNATVTAQCGGKTAKCIVTVIVPVTSITLDKSSLTLAVGETSVLTATVKPDNATDKTISWSSSDPSVVKVDNGKLTALKVGTAVVSVIAANFSASCSVTVNKPNNILYYTSSDGNVVKTFDETAFGAKILSNEYSWGMGRIIFDGPVTSIGRNAFYESMTLKTVDLPETVSSIGDKAFFYCDRLEKVTMPTNVKTIGYYAFAGTNKIKSVELPQGLLSIGEGSFSSCGIAEINIPGSVISIGKNAFSMSYSLIKVEIQEGVTALDHSTFWFCTHLSTVKLPSSLTDLGISVFGSCDFLTDLYIKAINPPKGIDIFGSNSHNTGMNIWVPRVSVDSYKAKWAEFKDNIKAYDF